MRNGAIKLRDESGFTLVELLVVIVIVGILAAIAIPTLLGERERGGDASAKAAATTVARALAIYRDDNDDSYACGSSAQCLDAVRAIEPNIPSTGVSFAGSGGSGTPTVTGYRITILAGQGRSYWLDHSRSGTQRGCDINGAPSDGGCDTHGASSGVW